VGLPPGVNPDAVHGVAPGAGQTEPMALASLALGVAGLMLSLCCLGLPLGVIAIGLGIVALTRIKPDGPRGKGLAITGIVLGVLGPVLYIALQLIGVAASFWP
jgi:hypothetical protein